MSYRMEAIEDVVASIHRSQNGSATKDEDDRLFGMLLGLLGGQMRYFIQLYGMEGRNDEARRICIGAIRAAIAEHRRSGGAFINHASIMLRQSLYGMTADGQRALAA
ncbi:hypothetical protein GRI38_12045 [Altererythrobacter aurantiacus]|uniref:Uncharacterized protein n=1 Tax=Parapontixanthobacter aurantiacus TaxID=1463599 RepID=A0A844ZI11_9SPHN|nr:hypothetical protein [Parapontixanthobacter aurantiacus]MXO86756.1 hypothetical protein [Parapontixanthobacter aurantiacus]